MKAIASTQFLFNVTTLKIFVLAVLLTALTTVFSSNARADSGVKYSRNFLRQEQGLVLRCITDSDRDCDAASRYLDAGLGPEAGDELVQALFNLAVADLKLEGELDRIAQLESRPFTYSKTDEQVKMLAGCANLRDRIQNDLARAATLSQHCIQGRTSSALKVYIAKRESYRNRIRNGFLESNIALDECRQLAVFPLALVANGLVNFENMSRCRVATDGTVTLPNGQVLRADDQPKTESTAGQRVGADELAALKKQSSELQSQMSRLQEDAKHSPRPLPVTNTLVIIVTNEVRTVVEKTNIIQSTTPLLPILTGEVTNAPVANLAQTPASSLAGSNIGVGTTLNSPKPSSEIKKPESDNFKAENLQPTLGQNNSAFKQAGTTSTTTSADADPLVQTHDSKKSHFTDVVLKLVVFAGGILLLVTVVSFTALSSAHHRPVKLTLTDDNTGNVHEIALMNAHEIVVLDDDPHSAPNVGQNDAVILSRNWLGNVLLHPYEGLKRCV